MYTPVGCCGAVSGLGADTIGWGTLPPGCGPMVTVQQNLTKAGFPVAPTGKLDEATAYALVNFQIAHNIPNEATSEQICAYLATVAAGLNPGASSWGGSGTPMPPSAKPSSSGAFLRPGWRPTPTMTSVRPTLPQDAGAARRLSSMTKVALIGGGVIVAGVLLLFAGGVIDARRKR